MTGTSSAHFLGCSTLQDPYDGLIAIPLAGYDCCVAPWEHRLRIKDFELNHRGCSIWMTFVDDDLVGAEQPVWERVFHG